MRRLVACVVAAFVLASIAYPAHAQERRRRVVVEYVPYRTYIRDPWIERPLTTEHRHLDLWGGLGFGYYDYYRDDTAPGGFMRPLSGAGTHVELRGGVASIVEVGGGFGLRFGGDSGFLGADRFARIDREWLPSQAESGTNPYYSNPYARVRIAFVNYAPAMIGLEFYNSFPFAPGTCLGGGIGLPMAFVAGHRVRFETGVYQELNQLICAPKPIVAGAFTVPLRINFQITPAFWLGIRTGLELGGFPVDVSNNVTVPLGFQGGVRVHPRVDIIWHAVLPEFLHNDPFTNTDVGFRAVVLGAGVVARLI
jgi:hypothetical protein